MLISLPLRSKRDAVVVRQRARQAAKLLLFDASEQACIAAGAFAIAVQALRWNKRGSLCLQTDRNQLTIFAQSKRDTGPSLRLVKPLPAGLRERSADDVGWILQQLEQLAPVDLFEEFQTQNQEMLATLHALQRAHEELNQLRKPSLPTAA